MESPCNYSNLVEPTPFTNNTKLHAGCQVKQNMFSSYKALSLKVRGGKLELPPNVPYTVYCCYIYLYTHVDALQCVRKTDTKHGPHICALSSVLFSILLLALLLPPFCLHGNRQTSWNNRWDMLELSIFGLIFGQFLCQCYNEAFTF